MKIGFVIDDTLDKPDGVQQYVLTLSAWLQSQGHDVHYLVGETHRQDLPNIHSLSKNVKVRFNKNRLSIPLPSKKAKLKQLLADEKFDVLHVQMPHSPLLAARIVRLAPKSTAIVGTFHIAPYSRSVSAATKMLGLWLRRNLTYFDQVISVSGPAHDFARKTFQVDSKILPNVIDIRSFQVSGMKHQRPSITFLGRLVPRKGCHHLLEAIAIIEKKYWHFDGKYKNMQYYLRVCGDGPERERLGEQRKKLWIKGKYRFLGQVSEDQKKVYLASADIAVFPSTGGESFGIVLLEAMAAGSGVVIAGDNPGYRSVLGSIPECMIDPTDHEAFAKTLVDFLTDEQLAKRVHTQQQALVRDYDVTNVGPKIVAIYDEAIAKRTKSIHN